jgi:hypothetical protein
MIPEIPPDKIGHRIVAHRPYMGGWIVTRDGQWMGWYGTELKAEREACLLALQEEEYRLAGSGQ